MLRAAINDLAQRLLTFNKIEQRRKLRAALEKIGFNGKRRILDFGCGTGLFAPVFKKMGLEYIGYDINRELLRYAAWVYPSGRFFSSKADLATKAPYDLILLNCCAHHISDGDLDVEFSFLKKLLKPAGVCLLVDIIRVPAERETFLHRQFMKLEQGQYVRVQSDYLALLAGHFTICDVTGWRAHLFGLPGRWNPIYNDLLVVETRLDPAKARQQ